MVVAVVPPYERRLLVDLSTGQPSLVVALMATLSLTPLISS
jgi:hypothetical protein